jgi:YVTN family beta-propeller protein
MTRRRWLATTGLAIATACAPRRRVGYEGYALVATAGDAAVTAIDLSRFQLARIIPLSGAPTAISASPHGKTCVLTPSTGSLHLIDNELNVELSRRLADELSNMQFAPDGSRAFTTAAHTRELIEVNGSDLQVLRRHKLTAEPSAMDISVNGSVAVASGGQGTVELLDTAGQRTRAQLPGAIGQLRFRGDGKLLLVANYHDRSLTVLTVPGLQVMADLPLAMQPENLCFTADQGQLFVSGQGMDALAIVFPYDMLEVEQTVLAGRDPGAMGCSSTPSYLFVASAGGSDICILDVDTRKVIGIVDVGQNPGCISITPDSRYALILDETSGDLAVIYIPSIGQNTVRTNRYKTGGALFTLLPVGNRPVHVAVVPKLA